LNVIIAMIHFVRSIGFRRIIVVLSFLRLEQKNSVKEKLFEMVAKADVILSKECWEGLA